MTLLKFCPVASSLMHNIMHNYLVPESALLMNWDMRVYNAVHFTQSLFDSNGCQNARVVK